MAKILLISSSFEDISLVTASKNKKTGVKTSDDSHYPLGLGYLHAYLEKDGNLVKTLFLNNQSCDNCFEKSVTTVKEFEPQIIGLQILTANRVSSYRLIEYFHQNFPDIKILIGGVHATIMRKQILERYPFAVITLGEGEITFSEIAKEIEKTNCNLEKIDGIAFYKNSQIITTSPRKLIENLDELPFPKHEIFFNSKRTIANIITSRGCPFNCSFCCLDVLSQRRVRKRSVENVIQEIEWLLEKFPQINSFWIHDDTFFIDNDRVIKFCDEIIKRNIKLNFICSGRVKPLNELMIKKMEMANFNKVMLGLESGDNSILKSCHKAITQDDVENAFRLFSKSKISIYAFLIVGLPGENEQTINETIRFVKKLQKIKYVYYNEDIAVLTVYPGTEIYEIFKRANKINDDFWLTDQPAPLFTLEHSAQELFAYKELILNNISLDRLFTFQGIKAQFLMLPSILSYSLANKNTFKSLLINFLKSILPKNTYIYLKNIFQKI